MTTDFGLLVRAELLKRDMTMKELAKMIGISQVYLSDILRGKKDGPKAQKHMERIKRILEI